MHQIIIYLKRFNCGKYSTNTRFFFETKAVGAKNLFFLIWCTAKKTRIDHFTEKLIFMRKLEEKLTLQWNECLCSENVFIITEKLLL